MKILEKDLAAFVSITDALQEGVWACIVGFILTEKDLTMQLCLTVPCHRGRHQATYGMAGLTLIPCLMYLNSRIY